MRWELLFADLEGQLDAARRTEDEARIVDLAELEMGRTELVDRLRATVGRQLNVRLTSGAEVCGHVLDAAPQWLLLRVGERRCIVPVPAVSVVWPLQGVAPRAGVVESRLGLAHVLRAIAREGATVRLHTSSSAVAGRVVRVGADHLDCDTGGPDRPGRVHTFAFHALQLVEST